MFLSINLLVLDHVYLVENNYVLHDNPLITHIISLSYNKDSLALWSNYSNHEGYNIGFSKTAIIKAINDSLNKELITGFNAGKVNYSKVKQRRILEQHIAKRYEQWKKTNDNTVCILLIADFMWYSIFFKSPKFKHEEEYRIAFAIKEQDYYKNIEFIETNQSLKPYVKIKFDCKQAVKDITIGSKNNMDIAAAGVMHFLKKYGYNEINVKKSAITLRY